MTGGRRRIIVTRRFPAITSLGVVAVPAGFVCDGASIPRAAWSIIGSPFDEFLEECVIHDYLYSAQNDGYTRAESDEILKELMWNSGIHRWKIAAFHLAVRLFGASSYKARISHFP